MTTRSPSPWTVTDLEAIVARDAGSRDLWFTGPPSFTAMAARDRRALLRLLADVERQNSELRADLEHKERYFAQFVLVPRHADSAGAGHE